MLVQAGQHLRGVLQRGLVELVQCQCHSGSGLVRVGGFPVPGNVHAAAHPHLVVAANVVQKALQRGDEVVTTGGELGRVTKVYEQYVGVELAENIEVTVQKVAIQSVLPKGTIKAIK